MEFIKKWGLIIIILLSIINTFKSCDTNNDISRLRKENNKTKKTLDSISKVIINEKQIKNEMEQVMLDFLIYEDELDGKKITISQIKDKIKEND